MHRYSPIRIRAVSLRAALIAALFLNPLFGTTGLGQVAVDKLHGYPVYGAANYTIDGGGHTAKPGDLAMDLGTTGGTSLTVNDPAFFSAVNAAAAADTMSVSLWVQLYNIAEASAFWFYSPTANSGQRAFQAHAPWSNDSVYFDTAGCCDGSVNRISAHINTLPGWPDDSWWNSWHHFVFIKSGTSKQIWIDGVLFLEGVNTGPLPTDMNLLAIGSGLPVPGATPSLRGLVDDFAVFGSALSSNDVQQIFAGTAPDTVTAAKPLAVWDFNLPAKPMFVPVQAGPGSQRAAPDLAAYYTLVNGKTSVQLSSIKLAVNGVDVTSAATILPTPLPQVIPNASGATIYYSAPTPFPQGSTQNVTLVWSDNGTPAYTYSNTWPVTIQTYNGYVADAVSSRLGFLEGSAAFTPDKGGRTGKVGDRAIDLNGVGAGGAIHVTSGQVLNAGAAKNTMSVSMWMKVYRLSDGGLVFARSPSSSGGELGFAGRLSADTTMWFDTAGCCDPVVSRMAARLDEFPGYAADTFWAKWHHFVFIYNANNKEIWIDGAQLGATANNSGALPNDFRDMLFGVDPVNNVFQQGVIDDVAVFSSALTPASISSLTNNVLPTALAGETLLAYWNCDTLSPGPPFISTASTPSPNSTNALPNVGANIIIVNRDTQVQTNTIKVSLNDTDVTSAATFLPTASGMTVNFLSPALLPALSTNRLTVVFSDNATPPNVSSNSWLFKVAPYGAYSQDVLRGYLATFVNNSQFTANGGGHGGGRALELTSAGNTGANVVDPPLMAAMNAAAGKDTLSISFWCRKYDAGDCSPFWVNSPQTSGGGRAFQAHLPWGNVIYFDTAGCCDGTLHRINANINTFSGYTDPGFWTNWHHYVFIKNGSAKQIYIDGQLFLEGINTASLNSDINNLYIGYAPGVASVRGQMDDFAVYGGALTAAHATALASGAAPTSLSDASLIAFWTFEDAGAPFISSRIPAPNSTGIPIAGPESVVSVTIVDGSAALNPSTIRMGFNGSDVTSSVVISTVSPGITKLVYQPLGMGSGATNLITITYSDTAAQPRSVSNAWAFASEVWTGVTRDTIKGYQGLLQYAARFSANGGGRSGLPGDYSMDMPTAGGAVHVPDGSFLNQASVSNIMTFAFWAKKYDSANCSPFWARSPSSSGGGRGFQSHLPWGNVIYFDTAGCCDGTLHRINADISTFPGYVDTGFWTNWHHYAFVYDNGGKFIYIDGQPFLGGYSANPLPTDFTQLWIGRNPADNVNIHAFMDDFAVFASALTAANAESLFQGAAPASLAGEKLVALWEFNDAAAGRPTIAIGLVNGKQTITYTGKLQHCPTAEGTYTDVPGAASPYVVDTTKAVRMFYRSTQ